MPLKIMLYVSLLLPANILLVKRISNIPMTIFSLFVFFLFCGGAVEIKKNDMCIYTRLRQACFLVQEQTAWA